MFDQRAKRIESAAIPSKTHRPDVIAGDARYGVEVVELAVRAWTGDNTPTDAVPMLDQGEGRKVRGVLVGAHRPDVVRGEGRYPVELGPKSAVGYVDGRADDDLPRSSDRRGTGCGCG